MHKKHVLLMLLAIVLLAFLMRALPLRNAFWWDETAYLQNAEVLFSGRTNYDEFAFRPPLLSLLYAGVFFVWHSPYAALLLTALINAGGIVFVFLIGKKIYGPGTGLIAAFLAAFAPFLVENGRFLMTDVPAASLLCISFYCLLSYPQRWMLALSGVFFSLAFLMKFTSVLVGVAFLVYWIVSRCTPRLLAPFFIGAGLTVLPYFAWAHLAYGHFFAPLLRGMGMVAEGNEPLFFYVRHLGSVFSSYAVLGIALFLLISLFFYRAHLKRDAVSLACIAWIVVFFAYLTYTSHKEPRYLLPILLPFFLLAARGFVLAYRLVTLRWKLFVGFLIALGLLLILSAAVLDSKDRLQWGVINPNETPEMRLSHTLLLNVPSTGIVYSDSHWPEYAYYTGLLIIQIKGGSSLASSFPLMSSDGLVLVHDPKSAAVLENNTHFEKLTYSEGVTLYRYRLRL